MPKNKILIKFSKSSEEKSNEMLDDDKQIDQSNKGKINCWSLIFILLTSRQWSIGGWQSMLTYFDKKETPKNKMF